MTDTTMERKGDREIIITRTFSAPARAVFDAWTQPELVKRWWAPTSLGVSVVNIEADVHVGGNYRYVLQAPGAGEFAFSGTYNEVTPHSRLVYTQVFEPSASCSQPGAPSVIITVTFDENNGQTRLVSHTLCPSKEVCDGMLASGMEHGMRETMNQLEELLASMHSE